MAGAGDVRSELMVADAITSTMNAAAGRPTRRYAGPGPAGGHGHRGEREGQEDRDVDEVRGTRNHWDDLGEESDRDEENDRAEDQIPSNDSEVRQHCVARAGFGSNHRRCRKPIPARLGHVRDRGEIPPNVNGAALDPVDGPRRDAERLREVALRHASMTTGRCDPRADARLDSARHHRHTGYRSSLMRAPRRSPAIIASAA